VTEIGKAAGAIKGVSKVLVLNSSVLKDKVAEDMAKAVLNLVKGYTHILCPSSNLGKNFLPRVAAQLDASPLSDIISVIDQETFQRPMYAGNAIATVKNKDPIKFLLVRSTAFDKAETSGGNATIENANLSNDQISASKSKFLSESTTKSARPELSSSRVVVSGGRGMKSKENFTMLESLADKLGGAVGASRAAVDAGFAPNDYQVGQTGKVVAPDLYIAVS
jgi:electron transfer flavoprotein alpha subunit